MAEVSRFWDGTTVGDATSAPYDAPTEFSRAMMSIAGAFAIPTNFGGVFRDELNELAVTGAVTPVTVATGRALVYGAWYENDAALTVAIPTPGGATRIDRIVLRKSWVAQTVRVTRIAGAEGGAAPAMTQVAGTTWDIPLAQVSITTGGAITVTSEREYVPWHGDQSGESANSIRHSSGQITDWLNDFDLLITAAATQRIPYVYDFTGANVIEDRFDWPGSTPAPSPDSATGRTRMVTSNTIPGAPGMASGFNLRVATFQPRAAENWHFKSMIVQTQAPVGGTVVYYTGFRANQTTGNQDGIFFRSTNAGNWNLVCRNAGVETTRDMGVAPSATPILLEFRISADGASVQGYVNGVVTGAVITTNIPTANGICSGAMVDNTGLPGTQGRIGVFWFGVEGDAVA